MSYRPQQPRAADGDRAIDIFDTFDEVLPEKPQAPWIIRKLQACVVLDNWLFLLLLGVTCGLVAFCIDLAISNLYIAQIKFVQLVSTEGVRWLLWVLWSMVFSTFSLMAIEFISPHAAGSGIPEMKCILSGIEIARYLNFRTLVAKIIGLICAFAGGLSIGKEGPMVHICSIICSLLSKIPVFSFIRRNDAALMEMLAAGCALGTTVAFGTPLGGVLFGIEVTSSFYLVDSLWRSFFVAGWGNIVYVITHRLIGEWQLAELAAFAGIGLVGGVLGGIFVKLLAWVFALSRLRPSLQTWWGHILRGLFISMLIGIIAYPFPLMRNDIKANIVYLAQRDEITDWVGLAAFFLAKYVFTILSIGFTGCTAGIYTAVFIMGAAGGRFVGEILNYSFPELDISPGAYAIVGAAALTSGVTRAVSSAVLAVELTGQIGLLLPVFVSVLISIGVGRLITPPVYNVLIQQKDLPAMPQFKLYGSGNTLNQVAADIMLTDVVKIPITYTLLDLAKLVREHRMPSFPVVNEQGAFLGVCRRRNITKVLANRGIQWKDDQEISVQTRKNDNIQDATIIAVDAIGAALRNPADDNPNNILELQVPFVFSSKGAVNDQTNVLEVDPTVMQISDQTPLSKVHFLFTVLGVSHLFVTMRGRLVGVITRKLLIDSINRINFPRQDHQESHIR